MPISGPNIAAKKQFCRFAFDKTTAHSTALRAERKRFPAFHSYVFPLGAPCAPGWYRARLQRLSCSGAGACGCCASSACAFAIASAFCFLSPSLKLTTIVVLIGVGLPLYVYG